MAKRLKNSLQKARKSGLFCEQILINDSYSQIWHSAINILKTSLILLCHLTLLPKDKRMKNALIVLMLMIFGCLGLWGYDTYKKSSAKTKRLESLEHARTSGMSSIRSALKDPASAQFKDVRIADVTGAVCGQVNAKNSYGGYSGFARFAVSNGQATIDDGSLAALTLIADLCAKISTTNEG
ncbi:hypothetical protein [Pseudomonas haemolytica]|jgi:hypothetical protein|uniref:Uncharacterized protein n=2 Tax=Pseudomonas TaxID=286 RepID=A0ABS1H1G4_9PSED|nr:hypothetical protein [Pseudomonas haemolytica]MBK3463049.1 hypothetical protein [Pseudomonas haemolytica]